MCLEKQTPIHTLVVRLPLWHEHRQSGEGLRTITGFQRFRDLLLVQQPNIVCPNSNAQNKDMIQKIIKNKKIATQVWLKSKWL